MGASVTTGCNDALKASRARRCLPERAQCLKLFRPMRVQADDAALLATLADWLTARGWPVADVGGTEAEVLVPWDEDEFAAALRLRCDVTVWREAHAGAVSVDRDRWGAAAR